MNINTTSQNNRVPGGDLGQFQNTAYDNLLYAQQAVQDVAGSASAAYPEVYYKLQPHILMAVDQMDAANLPMTRHMMDNTADNIRSNVVRTNPEVAEYAGETKNSDWMPEARAAVTYGPGYGPGSGLYDGGYRSRGFLRDLIDILLLTEYYRRRRYPY